MKNKETIAILNGEKMILPKYTKYGGLYGIFTTQGFVTCGADSCQDLEIETINYQSLILVDGNEIDKVFSELPYPKFN